MGCFVVFMCCRACSVCITDARLPGGTAFAVCADGDPENEAKIWAFFFRFIVIVTNMF